MNLRIISKKLLWCFVIFGTIGFVGSLLLSLFFSGDALFDPRVVDYCVDHIEQSHEIQNHFGSIKEVRLSRYSARRITESSGSISGRYKFDVLGSNRKGSVMAYWRVEKDRSIQVGKLVFD